MCFFKFHVFGGIIPCPHNSLFLLQSFTLVRFKSFKKLVSMTITFCFYCDTMKTKRKVINMKNKIKIILLTAIVTIGLGIGVSAEVKNIKTPAKAPVSVQKTMVKTPDASYIQTNPLDIVANPTKYLNKRIKIKAKFDKFSALGLDYKPAYRSSEKYITFLIKRDNVANYTVPLSEMKNFLSRDIAEKYIDLKPGDEIEYTGTVFSDALSDAWINVETFKVLSESFKEKPPVKK